MNREWDSEAYAILARAAEFESLRQQRAYLDEACAGNQALRERVERLLDVYAQSANFLQEPTDGSKGAGATQPLSERIGNQIGPYKLLEEIGEGGFGVVYMAEQQRPVRRKVALKIIKPGMDSREVIARFEAEQQALAMMDHPNIARVLDAGTTANGRPYFAMELVKGVPITEYCDKNKMSLPERLSLFVTGCRAVQHAHQKGVIHRDIKPSNIMVTLHDGKPVPKIIDFGVAKAINQQLTDKTLFTHFGQMIGTPQYMSPEQAEMSGLEVDTRSDIYSLGVVLYEMLTATTPVSVEQLRATGLAEIQRVIREEEPATPSTRLSTLGDRLTIIASHRQCDPIKLGQLLHGELDWIVMKSLDKDRARRYETASAFANDIEAYLHDEPVQARPPSVGYLLGKAIRKHRGLAITSALIAAILLAATAISVWQAIDKYALSQTANRLRAEALANLNTAEIETTKARIARQQAEQLKDDFKQAKDEASQKAYVSDMDHTANEYAAGNMEVMYQKLDKQPAELRDFDWYHWWLAGHLHTKLIYDPTPKWNLSASPDGAMVAVGVWPWITRLYRTKDTVLVAELPTGGPPSFSPDGKLVVIPSGQSIKIWSTVDGTLVYEFDSGHSDEIVATAFSPMESAPVFVAGDESGRISVWNASTWQLIGTTAHKNAELPMAVRGLAFLKQGNTFVAGSDSGDVVAYDVATCKETQRIESAHTARMRVLESTQNADLLATADDDGNIQLWDEDLNSIGRLSALAPITSLMFSADGSRLVTGTSQDNSILVWNLDAASPKSSARILGHLKPVSGVAILPDSNTVWSTSSDSTIRIWDLNRCEPFDSLEFKSADGSRLAYSSDGGTLMIIRDEDEVRRWDFKIKNQIQNDGQAYSSVAISTDGAVLAGVTDNKSNELCVWNVNDPKQTVHRCNLTDLDLRWNTRTLPRKFSPPLAVTQDGEKVAIPSEAEDQFNTEMIVIDMRTGKVWCRIPPGTDSLAQHPKESIQKVWPVFSPDGNRLAVQRFDRSELWDISGEYPVFKKSFQGFGMLAYVAFSPNGRTLAIAGDSINILLYDIATGSKKELFGHASNVTSLAFSRDGTFLVSGGDDGTVRMWETVTGQRRSTFTGHSKSVTSVAVSPTSDSIASHSTDGTIRIWLSATEEEVKHHTDEVLVRADQLFRNGEWRDAQSLLDEAIQNSPRNGRLFAKRGDLRRLQRNWKAALEDYNSAIARLGPNDVGPYKERAEMYVRLGQRSLAVNDFVKAIRMSPILATEQSLNQIRNMLAKRFVTEADEWSYTTTEPPTGWEKSSFDDGDWPKGRAPFGFDTSYLDMSLARKSNTNWMSKDIWLRCTFTAEEEDIDKPLILNAYINDYADVFINGVLATQEGATPWWEGPIEVADNVNLKVGGNVLAVHCQNRSAFGYGKIDVGLYLRAVKDTAFMDVLKGALEQSPDRPELNAYLADQHAHRQQWAETGECIDRLIASSPNKSEDWLKAAALSVYNRDLERYHQLCGLMLARFAETNNSQNAEMIAKACLLAPPREANVPAIREMIVKVQRSRLGSWFVPFAHLATALAELRSGNNPKAIEWADKSLAETSGGVAPNWEWAQPVYRLALAVKALAHARLGERELAIKEATEFKQFVQEQSPLHTSVPVYTNWNNWLTCEILLREISQEMPEIKN